MSARIILIAAVGRNGVIGRDGGLAWSDPKDLRSFRTTTLGSPIIMGRKTWDSLPAMNRPLKGRTNIVMSRGGLRADGAHVVSGVDEAIALSRMAADASGSPIFVIGGAEIYRQFAALADGAIITHVDADLDGSESFDLEALARFRVEHDSGPIQPTEGCGAHGFRRVTYGAKGLR